MTYLGSESLSELMRTATGYTDGSLEASPEEKARAAKALATALHKQGQYTSVTGMTQITVSFAAMAVLHQSDFPPRTIVVCRGYVCYCGSRPYVTTAVGREIHALQYPPFIKSFMKGSAL